jgi:hypothetical protein
MVVWMVLPIVVPVFSMVSVLFKLTPRTECFVLATLLKNARSLSLLNHSPLGLLVL